MGITIFPTMCCLAFLLLVIIRECVFLLFFLPFACHSSWELEKPPFLDIDMYFPLGHFSVLMILDPLIVMYILDRRQYRFGYGLAKDPSECLESGKLGSRVILT